MRGEAWRGAVRRGSARFGVAGRGKVKFPGSGAVIYQGEKASGP